MDSREILRRFYGEGKRSARRRRRAWWLRLLGRAVGRLLRRLVPRVHLGPWLRRNGRYLLAGSVLLVVWLLAHLYYYNRLVSLEFNVQEAWAQVEVHLQRRHHIQTNLVAMVLSYARHERDVLTQLTKLRVSAVGRRRRERRDPAAKLKGSGKTPDVAALERRFRKLKARQLQRVFPQIQFMAEQYPKLRLNETYQQFTRAIVTTESQIAGRIEAYNVAVNAYTTVLGQFPGNLFGRALGFPWYEYYKPTRAALSFTPIALKLGGPKSRARR